jgi:hypothetical protein
MPRGLGTKAKRSEAAKPASHQLPSGINIANAHSAFRYKGKTVSFKVLLRFTNEKFSVNNCPVNLKVKDLKGFFEFICGIPYNVQKLCYLDEGSSSVKYLLASLKYLLLFMHLR